jgi:hypothetical protein
VHQPTHFKIELEQHVAEFARIRLGAVLEADLKHDDFENSLVPDEQRHHLFDAP